MVAALTSVIVVAAFVTIAVLLKQSTAGTAFHTSDQIAMAGLGLLIAAGIMLVARPRVVADAERIRVRNIVLAHDLRWEVVVGISFPDGASWATLDLQDDETIALQAIQAVDKQRAVDAVQGLRALLAASRSAPVSS